jgi:hypothetical protein
MLGIPNKLENIPLRDADMLEQVPRRMGDMRRPDVESGRRESIHCLLKGHVGPFPL